MKIAFVGAGSVVFGQNVLTDIIIHPSLTQDMTICLEDIDPVRLDLMYRLYKAQSCIHIFHLL